MKPWLFLLAAIAICFVPPAVATAEQACPNEEIVTINALEVSGNERTDPKVIVQELGLALPQQVCETQLQTLVNRLMVLGIFLDVTYSLKKDGAAGTAVLQVSVREKWTTIPIVKVNSGGGVSQYTLGVYDPNLFGKFLEAGAQYENLGGAGSGVAWFKNPRLFGKRQGIDLQYWNTKRIRIKYDQEKDDPEIKRAFLHEREKIYAEYFREIQDELNARISLDYNNDDFSTDLLPAAVLEKVGAAPVLPLATEMLISKAGIELGKITGPPQALEGRVFGAYLSSAQPLKKVTQPFSQLDLSYTAFVNVAPRWQIAQRVLLGSTSAKAVQYWYYLGGLDRIRGFSDNRFSGSHFVLGNSEARYLSYESSNVLVQAVGFCDLGAIGDEVEELSRLKAGSLGAGIRFILPKFYRFVIRVDYAKPIAKSDTMNGSFGVQQYF